jgi:hypothetical protein
MRVRVRRCTIRIRGAGVHMGRQGAGAQATAHIGQQLTRAIGQGKGLTGDPSGS